MLSNLIRALQDEAILLVLDNFETNLEPRSRAAGESRVWACMDPAWDRCLARLAAELGDSRSRVLITCRRPLAALAGTDHHARMLGPLPKGEAALFLKRHPGLRTLLYSRDATERTLAERVLKASRFHPLLMDRLGMQAKDPALWPRLRRTLEALETSKPYAQLVDLFAEAPTSPLEREYLADALTTSLDQLLEAADPDARRLLWTVAVADDAVALEVLQRVWLGETGEGPALEPLRDRLAAVGLVHESQVSYAEGPALDCHELVRERVREWMDRHPHERGASTEDAVRLALADRLEEVFWQLQHTDMTRALAAGTRALVHCVQARAYERLGVFASAVVTSTTDRRLLNVLVPHLEAAAASAPAGALRWRCLTNLADALRQGGSPERSLPFYEQAAAQARGVAEAGGDEARGAWSDLGVIYGNWAAALRTVGRLGDARQRYHDAAEAAQKAGRPAVDVLGSELEALRIDIMQGHVAAALPAVESRLGQVVQWWQRYRAGQPVPEAPNAESLARTLISALDIATDAHFATTDWERALSRIDAILDVEHTLGRPALDIAGTRMNRANVLVSLRRFDEARDELEASLELFRDHPAERARTLSSLADLLNEQGDVTGAIAQQRRALALRDTLLGPKDRALSHNNLAVYLGRSVAPSDGAAAPRHRLAALLYVLEADLGQHLQTSLHNYTVLFHRARATGGELTIPRVHDLLADPAFHPLAEWLHQRGVDPTQLQTRADQFLDTARAATVTAPD